MTQRNNLHTADPPPRAKAFAATVGQSGLMNTTDTSSTRVTAPGRTRRASRIAAALPIEVRDQFGARQETRTQFLMVRGAVLATTCNVRVGHKLTIRNLKNGRLVECHVISVESGVKQAHQVEVEFTRPQPDFWPVQFPADELKANEAGDSSVFGNSYSTKSLMQVVEHEPSSLLEVESPKTSPIDLESESSPKLAKHDDQLVVLADSLSEPYAPSPAAINQVRYSAKTAPLDSVAQFRAANRAAHRRERQMKVFYSFLSVVALAGAVMGARNWGHLPSIPNTVVVPAVQPTLATPSQPTIVRETQTVPAVPVAVPEHASSNPSLTATTSSARSVPEQVELKPAATQVRVKRGALSASLHKRQPTEEEEAPMALPLRPGDETAQAKPEMLNSVVSQLPVQNAVLAPEIPKKVVPAKLLHSVPAQYPQMARQIRTEGQVLLSVDIDAAGNVSSAKAISGPPLLRGAAIDAVQHWKYQPATLGDKPIPSQESVKIDFRLR
jgi:TonB family protein